MSVLPEFIRVQVDDALDDDDTELAWKLFDEVKHELEPRQQRYFIGMIRSNAVLRLATDRS
jgi:hypothetical protein